MIDMQGEKFAGDLCARTLYFFWANSGRLRKQRQLISAHARSSAEVRQQHWPLARNRIVTAARHVPAYAEYLLRHGLQPEDICGWEDFHCLPLLTRTDLLRLRDPQAREIPLAAPDDSLRQAAEMLYRQWSGWRPGERMAVLDKRGGASPALFERCIYPDLVPMDEAAMLRFYRRIQSQSPTLLCGTAVNDLLPFARFLHRLQLFDIRPRAVLCRGGFLPLKERREIETVFACPVNSHYHLPEVGLVAAECSQHLGMHLNLDCLLVEVLAEGRPVAAGQAGEIVITDLSNGHLPVIRWRTGDRAILRKEICACGCRYPLIDPLFPPAEVLCTVATSLDPRFPSPCSCPDETHSPPPAALKPAVRVGGASGLRVSP